MKLHWFLGGLFLVVILIILIFAFEKKPRRVGLLTDDYGIVTKEDLDYEEKTAYPVKFDPKKFSVFNYWQCLKPDKYYVSCRPFYFEGEGYLGELTFWVLSEGKKYNFWTHRNYPKESCLLWEKEIKKIMQNQKIVCISASYSDQDVEGSHWFLERIKTKTDFWSMSRVWSPDE